MNTNPRLLGMIMTAVIEIIMALVIFRDPFGFTEGVLLLVGMLLAAVGLIDLIRHFHPGINVRADMYGLYWGISALLAGVVLIVFRKLIANLFSELALLYGILLIVFGVYKFRTWSVLRLAGIRSPVTLIGSIAASACGIILAIDPFAAAVTLWRFAAAVLIVEAALDVLDLALKRHSAI